MREAASEAVDIHRPEHAGGWPDVVVIAPCSASNRRIQSGLHSQPCNSDRILRLASPPERTRNLNVNVSRTSNRDCACDLALKIAKVRHARGRNVRYPVCHREAWACSCRCPTCCPVQVLEPESLPFVRQAEWHSSAARPCSYRLRCRSRGTAHRRCARTSPDRQPNPMSVVPPSPPCATTRTSYEPARSKPSGDSARDGRCVTEQRV